MVLNIYDKKLYIKNIQIGSIFKVLSVKRENSLDRKFGLLLVVGTKRDMTSTGLIIGTRFKIATDFLPFYFIFLPLQRLISQYVLWTFQEPFVCQGSEIGRKIVSHKTFLLLLTYIFYTDST